MSHVDVFGGTCDLFTSQGQLENLPVLQGFESIVVVLLSLLVRTSNGVFTSAGISPTFAAFIPLSPFETLLVGMVLLQIFVLQLYGIVPFDLNKLLHGDFSGMGFSKTSRKKRMILAQTESDVLLQADKILAVILLTDHYDCVTRTLCEVQKKSLFNDDESPPALFIAIFHIFKFLAQQPPTSHGLTSTSNVFAEAVKIGHRSFRHGRNSTDCEVQYSSCPLTTSDIMSYIDDIKLDQFS